MKKAIFNSSLFGLLTTFSQLAHAHPGHDHSHWSSQPLHVFTIAVITAVVVSRLIYKKASSHIQKKSIAGE